MVSTLNSDERRTVREYDQNAAFYKRTEPHLDNLGVSEGLLTVRKLMVDDPFCLDVGCGHGRMFPAFRNSGIGRYVGIDPSRKSIEIAQKNYPNGDFRVLSVYDLSRQFPDHSFDAFFAITTLAHIPPGKWRKALECIRRVIRKDGIGCITMIPLPNTVKLFQTKLIGPDHTGPFTTMYGFDLNDFSAAVTESGFELYEPVYEQSMLVIAVRAV